MKRVVTLCFFFLLASCYGLEKVEELRSAPSAPSAFHQELARLYLQFVDKELDKYDWDSAGYFAAKGLDAAHGKDILPEDPNQWSIPSHTSAELSAARAQVIAKLSAAFRQSRPQEAASMLFHYDCWVEEQEEAWEQSAIDACKQQVMLGFTEMDTPLPMGGPLSTSYLFHFPQGQAALDGLAQEELQLMARTMAGDVGAYSLVINGHADMPGTERLSAQRAAYLRDKLVVGGVPANRIDYNPYSDAPAHLSMSGNEQRIEIFIE